MRKTRVLAAAALLTVGCLGTAGCDGDDTSTSGSGTSTTSTTTNTGQGGQGGQGEGGSGGQGEGGSGGQGEGGSGGQGQGGSGGQGQGGSGGSAPECVTADDCPPSANECAVPACDAGMCGTAPVPPGTQAGTQTAGDCQRTVCDGNGGTAQENDDTDAPDDGLDCTVDGCSMGAPTSAPAPAGTACDDAGGQVCNASGQCITSACGNGVMEAGESCDDGNTADDDGCDSNCTPTGCGNGVVTAGEGCDDGDTQGYDGCDAACAVEQGYTCSGAPSVCVLPFEMYCLDGGDNDGDGMVDCADPDCAGGCDPDFVPCAAGQALVVIPSADVPQSIADVATTTSVVSAGDLPGVFRAAVQLDVTHTYVSDLSVALDAPSGEIFDLAIERGDSGDNFAGTLFDSACATPISSGTAPFAGCYQPESSLASLATAAPQGDWTLSLFDGYSGDTGTLNSWSLVLCTAPVHCGNGVTELPEQCDDGNDDNSDGCLNTCVAAACGDGFTQPGNGESCDDGNNVDGDCCSSTCQKEPGCETEPNSSCGQAEGPYTPSPSVTLQGTINPALDLDYFAFTVPAHANVRVETFSDAAAGVCAGGIDTVIELRGQNCTTVLVTDDQDGVNSCSLINPATDAAARQLAPGTYYVRVEDYYDGVIPAYDVVITLTSLCGNGALETYEGCDDGNLVSGDGCDANCKTTACGNGVLTAGEACDDGNTTNGDGCDNNCTVSACGNGIVAPTEGCDDANVASNDGCSATCAVEPGYTCAGQPSVCAQPESICNDGVDNDGDGAADLADTDCALGNSIAACGAGELLYVYRSSNVPKAIPDLSSTTSTLLGLNAGTISRAVVRLSVTHTWISDVDLSLTSPAGTTIDLSSDNGSSGDNYTNTIFDNLCAASITTGTAPFTGCYTPEQPLTSFAGQAAAGTWTLTAADDEQYITGSVTAWTLALCVTP